MGNLQLKVPPLLLLAIFVAVTVVNSRFFSSYEGPYQPIMSCVLLVFGGVVMLLGVVEFRRHKTTVNPLHPNQTSSIVATGIYRFTRNPMYLGMLMVLSSAVLYWLTVINILLLPLFIWYLNEFQIKPEERMLSERFGEVFASYQKKTRRWI